jgi:hypothetical protein
MRRQDEKVRWSLQEHGETATYKLRTDVQDQSEFETPLSFIMSAPNTPRSLRLFFWVLGLSITSDVVTIDDNYTVDDLRNAIVKRMPGKFDAHELKIWKVSIFTPPSLIHAHTWKVSIPITKQLKESVSTCQLLDETSLMEVDLLSDIFPLPLSSRTLHIIAQRHCNFLKISDSFMSLMVIQMLKDQLSIIWCTSAHTFGVKTEQWLRRTQLLRLSTSHLQTSHDLIRFLPKTSLFAKNT